MNKIKNFYARLHLNFTKELILIIVLNALTLILGIALFVLLKSINYIVLMFVIFIFINAILIYRYILLNNKCTFTNLQEVSSAFMYFYLDINNNVMPIDALNNLKSHCTISMSDNLVLLLDEIKLDKTFTPFIKFSNKYPSIIVEPLVLAIYQLVNKYNLDNIVSFNKAYKEYKSKVEEIYSKTYKKQFSFITLTPVIGTMIITVLVIIATILLVRGYING